MWSKNNKWRYIALIFCGILLFADSLSLNEPTRVVVSDTVAGVAVALLALISLIKPRKTIDWTLGLIAAYLLLAPILLWAKTGASYLNDILIGALIFTFAILLSPEEVEEGDGVPPGWNYNPSAYGQRLPVITLAFFAFLFSRYMAFYQLGYINSIWDPVFGDGTHAVITSDISRQFPVSDAGLGSWVYAVEVLMGIHGSKHRWHTLPWFVTFFALLVIPAGLVSVLLMTLQPLLIGTYCFWCLITALAMLFMIAFAADEVVATIQFLLSVRRRGGDVGKAFWHGDPSYETYNEKNLKGSRLFFGLTFPWNLVVSALIGFWMMFFQIYSIEAVLGALVITFSVISFAEVLRPARWVNVLLGLLVLVISMPHYLHIAGGIFIVLLAIPKGKRRFSYQDW